MVEICRVESNAPLSGALKGASNGNTLASDATCGKNCKVKLELVVRAIDLRCDPALKQRLTVKGPFFGSCQSNSLAEASK